MSIIKGYWYHIGVVFGFILIWSILVMAIGAFFAFVGMVPWNPTGQLGSGLIFIGFVVLFVASKGEHERYETALCRDQFAKAKR